MIHVYGKPIYSKFVSFITEIISRRKLPFFKLTIISSHNIKAGIPAKYCLRKFDCLSCEHIAT